MCFSKRTESNKIGLYLDVLVWLFPLGILGIATIEGDFHGRWKLSRRDGLVSLVMPGAMLVTVAFSMVADTKLELFVKTTTSLYGSCIQIYCCLHFSVKLEHKRTTTNNNNNYYPINTPSRYS